MRVTIIPADRAVYVDGTAVLGVDCSALPADVHAIQWDGITGHIERRVAGAFHTTSEALADITPYLPLVEAHRAKLAEIQKTPAAQPANANPTLPAGKGMNVVA